MKKVVLFCVLLMGVLNYSIAQRYAYVDTQYILDNMPEYAAAQLELDKVSEQWEKEIEILFQDVDKKRKDYESEAILLPIEIKKQREKASEYLNHAETLTSACTRLCDIQS